eukprot:tig00001038_g6529.t1
MASTLAAALGARDPDRALEAMMRLKAAMRTAPDVNGEDGLAPLTKLLGSSFLDLFDTEREGAKGMYSDLQAKFGAAAAQKECSILLRSSAADLLARCLSSGAASGGDGASNVAKALRGDQAAVEGLFAMIASNDVTEAAAAAHLLVWVADSALTHSRLRSEAGLKLLGLMLSRSTRKEGRPVSSIERVTLLHSALTLIERAILPVEIQAGADPLAVLPALEITPELKEISTWATVSGMVRALLDTMPVLKTMVDEDGLQPQTIAKQLTIIGFLGLVKPSKDAILQHPLFPAGIQPYLQNTHVELKRCAAIALAPLGKDVVALRTCGGCGKKEQRFAEYKRCSFLLLQ